MAIIIMAILGGSSGMTVTSRSTAWRVGTVQHIRYEALGVRTFTFVFDDPVFHLGGQHYELRLTGEDGYQAARLYSAATPADGTGYTLELTIARMTHGEVSSYLFEYVTIGSQIELRGPLGKYFVWKPEDTESVLLIGGGTGVVPLRAMLKEHSLNGSKAQMEMLYSTKSYQNMLYRSELIVNPGVTMTFTEEWPPDWSGYVRRIDRTMLEEVLSHFAVKPRIYICGPTPMVEAVANQLLELGQSAERILTERFGATK